MTNPFTVYLAQPANVYFEFQEKGEKIILLLRAHLVTLIPSVVVTFTLLVGPLFIGPVANLLGVDLASIFSATQLFFVGLFWYLVSAGYAFYKFIFWYFNVYLLTNERIIDFDFRGILHKETSFAKLNQIQDVSPKVIGFFGTFFHYGNVFIQTAAERPEFEFHNVAMPEKVAQAILNEVRLEEKEPPGEIA